MDKGAGILAFLEDTELDAAMYVGDDATDLDAFRALGEMRAEGRLRHALRVGVASEEGPTEIAEEADLVVDGTDGVRHLLEALLADDDA
jgi:trehalose 6-phosphate phosphatase